MAKPIHFIGIGGSGMAPLAAYNKACGATTCGSDSSDSARVQKLRSLDITVYANQSPENLSNFKGECVYSSAISSENPELAFAKKSQQISCIHRSALLARFCGMSKESVAVSGTHGKTTTSFLCHHIIKQITKKSCGLISGASFSNNELGYEHDKNQQTLVFEADESDGTFLNYLPTVAIINNIDEDHLDFYKSYKNILEHFSLFASQVLKNSGSVVIYDRYKHCLNLPDKFKNRVIYFGEDEASHYKITAAKPNGSSTELVITKPDGRSDTFQIPLLGTHNSLNFAGALAAAEQVCQEELMSFNQTLWIGIDRRLNVKKLSENVHWIDDYAHNTEKIKACISTAISHFPNAKIKVIFQPHRYTRLRNSWHKLTSMFKNCQIDSLNILPVYAAGEAPIKERDSESLCKYLKRECEFQVTFDFTRKNLLESLNTATSNARIVIVTVGAGDIKNRFSNLFDEDN